MDRATTLAGRLVRILTRKREKLLFYDLMLANLHAAVSGDDLEKVTTYTEMGRALTGELEALQSALNSLEPLYRSSGAAGAEDRVIVELSGEVLLLQARIRESIDGNCSLLKTRMENIKNELSSLRLPRDMKSLYGGDTARRIDISF